MVVAAEVFGLHIKRTVGNVEEGVVNRQTVALAKPGIGWATLIRQITDRGTDCVGPGFGKLLREPEIGPVGQVVVGVGTRASHPRKSLIALRIGHRDVVEETAGNLAANEDTDAITTRAETATIV